MKNYKEVNSTVDYESSMNGYVSRFEELKRLAGDPQVAAAILAELGKDRRAMMIRAERAFESRRGGSSAGRASESELATARQREFLKKLSVSVPEGLSKAAASRLIDEALAAQEAA